ncbi:hypothetical protein U91I_00172 [alpha proteobacterium U9-1i]|nr:hypothetical protein U91I_00172 [alpha proteobacterium U9-1i]
MTSAPSLNTDALRAIVALLRRWSGFVLLWLARLPIQRSRADIIRMERRIAQLIFGSAFTTGFAPGAQRMGSHRVGRSYRGSWHTFILRNALPQLSAFNHDRLTRIKHVAANIDRYVKRFMRKLARGLLMRRCAKRGGAPLVLISHAPASANAFADTS